jgi:hypothetical protein
MRLAGAHERQASRDRCVDIGGHQPAARRVVADQILDRPADGDHAAGIVEQLLIALVPRDEAQIGIDDADALREIFQGRAQAAPG